MWGCYFSIKMAHMGIGCPEWKVWTIVKYLAASASWLPTTHCLVQRLQFPSSIKNACGSWGFSSAFKGIDKRKPISRYQRQSSVEALLCLHYQLNSKETLLRSYLKGLSLPVKMIVQKPSSRLFGVWMALCEDRACGSRHLAAPLDDKAERWSGPGPQIALQGLRASPEQLGGLQATGLQKTWMWLSD